LIRRSREGRAGPAPGEAAVTAAVKAPVIRHPPLTRFAETMAIAAAGGALFDLFHFPAGWLAGALVFVAVAALFGRSMYVPTLMTRIFFIALGTIIGGVASPETVQGMSTWPASILMICVAMLAITVSAGLYLRHVHAWDFQTALFASVPGALSQVSAIASERDIDVRAIIIVQTVRLVILAVGVPLGLAIAGVDAPAAIPVGGQSMFDAPLHFVLLIAGCIVAALALYRIGFSGGFFFGPMIVSAVLHGSGTSQISPPGWVASVAMIGLGAINGARFNDTSFRLLFSYLLASLGALAVAMTTAAVFVGLASMLPGLRVANLVIAYAPGSVDVMMILALALHLDPVFVGAHHLARIFVVSVALPMGARLTDVRKPQHHELPETLEIAKETLED
jgi:membrane AbrB-like protein